MTNPPQIYLPTEELQLLLSERERILTEQAVTQANYKRIEALGRELPTDIDLSSIDSARLPSSTFDNPVDGMHETLEQLQSKMREIQQLSSQVQSTTAEIAQRENQRKAVKIVAVLMGGSSPLLYSFISLFTLCIERNAR